MDITKEWFKIYGLISVVHHEYTGHVHCIIYTADLTGNIEGRGTTREEALVDLRMRIKSRLWGICNPVMRWT